MLGLTGAVELLTLPLSNHPRDTLIRDLVFASNARARFDERRARHYWLAEASGIAAERLRACLYVPLDGSVVDYLEGDFGWSPTFSVSTPCYPAARILGSARS